jgi:hypothetical protein
MPLPLSPRVSPPGPYRTSSGARGVYAAASLNSSQSVATQRTSTSTAGFGNSLLPPFSRDI